MENKEIPWTLCKDSLPDHDCQCLVLMPEPYSFFEICYYTKKRKRFTYWDHYNDCEDSYKSIEVKAWVELKQF